MGKRRRGDLIVSLGGQKPAPWLNDVVAQMSALGGAGFDCVVARWDEGGCDVIEGILEKPKAAEKEEVRGSQER